MLIKEYSEFGRILLDYDRRFKIFMKSDLEEVGLTFAETMTLMSLFERADQTADSLVVNISYDKSVVTRTLQSLEKRGLVGRVDNPRDGRSYLFRATEDGLELRERIGESLRRWCQQAFQGISEEEMLAMLQTLRKIRGNVAP